MPVQPHQVVAFILAIAVSGCGKAERQAAEAKADSLQRVLQRQQDSFKTASKRDSLTEVREQDSLKRVRDRAAAQAAQVTAQKQARAESISAELARPHDVVIMNTTGVTIGPQKYSDYAFILDSAADCIVHGRIEVLSGGTNKDVKVYLFTADDFTNWKNNHTVTPLFNGGQQTVTTLNTRATEAGEYHLVVSNYFSMLSGKTAKGQVTVTCRGLQPRQP